jgi:hypothetical protein
MINLLTILLGLAEIPGTPVNRWLLEMMGISNHLAVAKLN